MLIMYKTALCGLNSNLNQAHKVGSGLCIAAWVVAWSGWAYQFELAWCMCHFEGLRQSRASDTWYMPRETTIMCERKVALPHIRSVLFSCLHVSVEAQLATWQEMTVRNDVHRCAMLRHCMIVCSYLCLPVRCEIVCYQYKLFNTIHYSCIFSSAVTVTVATQACILRYFELCCY